MTDACLVLDFDGTILDTEGPLFASWAELWDEHGVELARHEWQRIIGTDDTFDPWAELEQRLARRLEPALQDRRRARYRVLQAEHELRDGIIEWLEEAARLGVRVGVASSSSEEWVESHLERMGLRSHFSCLACKDEVVPAKPDPTSYRLTCERLGADPAASVAVEDSPHGVAAAVAAGLFTVAVPHGLTHDLDLSAADLVVESLHELTLAEALERARRRS